MSFITAAKDYLTSSLMKYLLKPIETFKWFYLTQIYFTQLENVITT